MFGNNKAAKEAFQGRKLEATLAHIINIAYDGEVLGATTRDPSGNELRMIYTHLWWMSERPIQNLKSRKKVHKLNE